MRMGLQVGGGCSTGGSQVDLGSGHELCDVQLAGRAGHLWPPLPQGSSAAGGLSEQLCCLEHPSHGQ